MDLQGIANQLNQANARAEDLLSQVKGHPHAPRELVERALRDYIAAKLLLQGDEISDNIVEMVRLNISKASHIPVEALKKMDRPGACGSAPAVLAKRVLLFVSIQKALEITFSPQELPSVRTIGELTDMVLTLMRYENT